MGGLPCERSGMLVVDSKSRTETVRQLLLCSVKMSTGRLMRKTKWSKCWEVICDGRGVNHSSKNRLMLYVVDKMN